MTVQYLKKGKEVSKAIKQAETLAEQQKNSVRRFWMKDETEAKITFLDGNLQSDGTLDAVVYHEHNIEINGRYGNTFVCIKEFEPCPLCEQGDRAAFVAAFTIIDHRESTGTDGTVYKDQVSLLVCKLETFKILQKIASKRDGLAGCTFDVSRTGDKSASVGNMFDFVSKKDPALIMKKYKAAVIDYEKAIPYYDEDTLRGKGFGKDNSAHYGVKPNYTEEEEEETIDEGMEEDL